MVVFCCFWGVVGVVLFLMFVLVGVLLLCYLVVVVSPEHPNKNTSKRTLFPQCFFGPCFPCCFSFSYYCSLYFFLSFLFVFFLSSFSVLHCVKISKRITFAMSYSRETLNIAGELFVCPLFGLFEGYSFVHRFVKISFVQQPEAN